MLHGAVLVTDISTLDLVPGGSYSQKLAGIIHTMIQVMPIVAILNHGCRVLPNPVSVIPDLG
jgi:hypothetical protein